MNRFNVFGGLIRAILLILTQVILFKNLVLFDSAFCFAYILVLLMIPMDTNGVVQLLVGFAVGMIVDSFYNTLGIHAAASVLLVYVRIYWSQVMTPSGGYDSGPKINVRTQGLVWFLTYAYPLILIHALLLFFVEAAGFNLFWQTLTKAFYSSIFTLIVVLIIQYLFYKKMK
ncbi:Rod shape-determining protein MreD [Reichenbachiella carrageenanivorans]|uniref:Rod shape-determining protein MreD n=1 Tax=Reichenbachiella carrageenanivorans TaxID=2979869 RepID=A0ABY6D225_9BACT|nr:Rod shape-determining protein MreD [Reichenbachiella carrageenanivorans]UXX80212.1 Rod shape-determining protein MreD [Reichenbachiella carrageenanivorans]